MQLLTRSVQRLSLPSFLSLSTSRWIRYSNIRFQSSPFISRQTFSTGPSIRKETTKTFVEQMKEKAKIGLGVGFLMGTFGSIAGAGGAAIAVPILSGVGVAVHQAIGTTMSAVVMTAVVASLSYVVFSGRSNTVDLTSAGLLTLMSTATVRVGARMSNRLSPKALLRVFGFGMLSMVPLVLHSNVHNQRQEILTDRKEDESGYNKESALVEEVHDEDEKKYEFIGSLSTSWPWWYLLSIGSFSGFIAGLLGVGGGGAITPLLSAWGAVPQATCIATSLTAIIPTAIVGASTHWKLGNVFLPLLPSLLTGTALGSIIGSRLAVGLSDSDQRKVFACVVTLIGLRTLWRTFR